MLRRPAYVRVFITSAFVSVALLTTSAYGQSPANAPLDKEVVAAQGPRLAKPENKIVADDPRTIDLEREVSAMKAENATLKDQLRKIDEQQKTMLEQFKLLQQRLEGSTTAADARTAKSPSASPNADASAPATAPDTSVPSPAISTQAKTA
ncbi:MAG TPA: hypothetical protein VHQ64_17200, partial [Pyrinomonadaceae bacterium]|nr:hypothetical protein [Pyrinomonadaceae bacterium]